ncbi:MAG: tetratricopeptide repeat protein, partial [Gemmatimonadales bacterium]
MTVNRLALLVGALGLAALHPAGAQEQLGHISFPNSGSAEAQPQFIRGVLLLHNFQYPEAAAAFRQVQKIDPGFALGYWGEALSYTHQVWNQQDLAAARTALGRLAPTPEARLAKTPNSRERMYLASAEALYGDGSKPRRDTLYADALERLVRAYPDDDEAKIFYSVALLGLNQGVRDVPTYIRAGAIAEDVLRRNPDHPGAAHFVIHAFDDPIHAPLGLYAARRYSEIAPGSPHAQHMTTHIFLALGMWDEVATQNEVASGPHRAHWGPGHGTHWLTYAYVQQGRYQAARQLILTLAANARSPVSQYNRGQLANFRARYVLDTEQWDGPEAKALTADTGVPGEDGYEYATFAAGYAAARRGDTNLAERLLGTLTRANGDASTTVRPGETGSKVVPVILEFSLRAELLRQRGARDEAIALLRRATALEDGMPAEFGPPAVVKPSHEFLAGLLLEGGRPAEAMAQFQRALELAPGRSAALLGLGRAARAAGEQAVAARAYAT